MNQLDYASIGRRLKLLRMTQEYTQKDLADRIGCNPSHISNIENNRVNVSLELLVKMCSVLHTSVDYVLFDDAMTPVNAMDDAILSELQTFSANEKKIIYKMISAVHHDA